MQKAKDAVSDILHRDKKHSVDIEQDTAAPVVHERIGAREHENVTTAIDREVHQHHHQTHIQPIKDNVVEDERHHHKVAAVESRHQHHGKDAEIERALGERQAQFSDEREVLPTTQTSSNQTVMGEHVHHHVHDTIQPVIERQVEKSDVYHTTVPVHERIEKEPVLHKGNVLPTMSMDEFSTHSKSGLGKKAEHIDYEGEPLDIKNNSGVGFGGHNQGETLGSRRD